MKINGKRTNQWTWGRNSDFVIVLLCFPWRCVWRFRPTSSQSLAVSFNASISGGANFMLRRKILAISLVSGLAIVSKVHVVVPKTKLLIESHSCWMFSLLRRVSIVQVTNYHLRIRNVLSFRRRLRKKSLITLLKMLSTHLRSKGDGHLHQQRLI